jgi:CheY-like chemotaxis protein
MGIRATQQRGSQLPNQERLPAVPSQGTPTKAVILLVEAHTPFRHILTSTLREWDYAVEAASNYDDGLELAKSCTYSLCLIDVDVALPGGTGIGLCRKIRSLDGKMPIVLLAISGDHEKLAIRVGAQACINKKELHDELHQLLRRLIGYN